MSAGRQIGRAKVLRHVGHAPIGRVRGVKQMPAAKTSVMTGPATAVPVFVDDSGRRRRRMRAITFAVACMVVLAAVVVWLSLSASPLRPDPVATCTPSAAHASKCQQR
ncbi:MAG TPA: hypothetical protein VE132_06760 [Micromonosporaceae bacterium]|nr:hypothetical protein [Micromonosporaceae bacterium]